MKTRRASRIKYLILIVLFSFSACSVFHPSVKMRSLVLEVAPQANDDAPIAVDFVVVNDPDLLKVLLTTSSAQWFAQREQYQRDYPQTLTVWGHELVPGQRLAFSDIPIAGVNAVGLLVFASYNNPGTHRLRLDTGKEVVIRLESKDLRLLSAS